MNFDEKSYQAILDVMEGREGEIVSTALIRKQADGDTAELEKPIKQLNLLGELTLIYVRQSGRVILNESVHPASTKQSTLTGGDEVWRCYIAEDYENRYHSGLFNSRDGAEEFLRTRVGDSVDDLEAVPVVENVYATEIPGFEFYGEHTVVIRGERVNQELSLRE